MTLALQAAKAYQEHQKNNGKPASHEKAKELLYVLSSSYPLDEEVDIWCLAQGLVAHSSIA